MKSYNLESLQDQINIKNIQLDLFDNAIVLVKKKILTENLDTLKEFLLRKLNKSFIHDILFIAPRHKVKRKREDESLRQKQLTDYIKNKEQLNYYNSLRDLICFKRKLNKSIQISLFNEIIPDKIETLQYRGNKSQVIGFLKLHFGVGTSVLDLMAGSQSVSLSLKNHSKIISNDVQYYSFVLGKAYIENNKFLRLNIIPKDLIKPDPAYKLFQTYFMDVYFTREQCIEIDNIRATIEKIKKIDKMLYYCYLACLIQCLDVIARTAGHFDGSLDQNTDKAKEREKKSVYKEFCKRIKNFSTIKSNFKNKCYNLPAEELLKQIPKVDIIYIDPPYNHRQYSRYYHLLETCAKYDWDINLKTKGLYPKKEFKSKFCSKDKVEKAFREILELSMQKAKRKILISYSNIGLLEQDELLDICKQFDPEVKLYEKAIKYTRQKTSKSNIQEKELLYILSIKNQNWFSEYLPDGKKTLVITSCSKRKDQSAGKIESIKRYTGQMFKMTKKFAENNNYNLLIISAKYGLLKPKDKIENYNLRLENEKQAIQLRQKVIPKLREILEKEKYERIIVIMGNLYKIVIEDLIDDRFVFLESKNGFFDYLSKLKTLIDGN